MHVSTLEITSRQIDNPIQSGYSSTRHIQLSFQISARPLIGQKPADRLRAQSS